jgi:protein phosphatase
MLFDYAIRASQGHRPRQEDAVALRDGSATLFDVETGGRTSSLLLGLADGLGGHAGGAVASRVACHVLMAALERSAGDAAARLVDALEQANTGVGQAAKADNTLGNMGTTLLAVSVDSRRLQWASVGDTHLFLYRDGCLLLLNADQSLKPHVEKLAAAGAITWEEAAAAPENNVTCALPREDVAADASPWPFALQTGDVLLAVTDGIDTLSHDKLEATCASLAQGNAAAIADGLLSAVADAGDPLQDNTTLCVVKVMEGERQRAEATKPRTLNALVQV